MLIDIEYTIAVGLQTWVTIESRQTDFGHGDVERSELYLKLTYPLEMLINVLFLYYNWIYVNQYLKAGLLLPLMLNAA